MIATSKVLLPFFTFTLFAIACFADLSDFDLVGKKAYFQIKKEKNIGVTSPGNYSKGEIVAVVDYLVHQSNQYEVVIKSGDSYHTLKFEDVFLATGCLQSLGYCVGDEVISDWRTYRAIGLIDSDRADNWREDQEWLSNHEWVTEYLFTKWQPKKAEIIGVQLSFKKKVSSLGVDISSSLGVDISRSISPRVLLKSKHNMVYPGNEGEVDSSHPNFQETVVVEEDFIWASKPKLKDIYTQSGFVQHNGVRFSSGDTLVKASTGQILGSIVGFRKHGQSPSSVGSSGINNHEPQEIQVYNIFKRRGWIALEKQNSDGTASLIRISWLDFEDYYKSKKPDSEEKAE